MQGYIKDTVIFDTIYMGLETGKFARIEFKNRSAHLMIDDDVFAPSFGGIYLAYKSSSRKVVELPKPADIFKNLNKYQIDSAVKCDLLFNPLDAKEFVYLDFSRNAAHDLNYDLKCTIPIYILTDDTTSIRVRRIDGELRKNGLRSIVRGGGLRSFITKLNNIQGRESVYAKSIILAMGRRAAVLNDRVKNGKLVGPLTEPFPVDSVATDMIRDIITRIEDSVIVLNISPLEKANLLEEYLIKETPIVVFSDIKDTLIASRLGGGVEIIMSKFRD